jgi:hypothetical protein
MKKTSALLIILAPFLVSACTFNVEVLTPDVVATESLTPTNTVMTTLTSSATVPAPATATPTQVLTTPHFSNARFTVDASKNIFQTNFPARTRQIYAVWDYQNMREGLIVRRDWYFNDVLWITREEPWDLSKYGANGTISDISVYELEVGLESGNYRLELYIDLQPQPIGEGIWPQFTISTSEETTRVTSPNGQWVADVEDPRKLLLRDTGKNVRELFSGSEIANLTWLPGSQYLLFVNRDRSNQQAQTNFGIQDDLWIVEITSGATNLLYQNTGFFGKFVVSPEGHYVASITGTGFGDACFVSSQLIFFELASDFRSAKNIKQEQFRGIPEAPDSVVYPVEAGTWQNETKYLVALTGTCNIATDQMGPYLFDLPKLRALKK